MGDRGLAGEASRSKMRRGSRLLGLWGNLGRGITWRSIRLRIRKELGMPSTYLPAREAELVTWSNNFNTLVQANAVTYGLTLDQATDYSAAHAAFVAAYQIANDPLTRSPANIEDKNDKKAVMIELTRELVNIIQAFPGTTNKMRSSLGITVKDVTPTPTPVPEMAPQLDVAAVHGRRMSIRLRDAATGERKKPVGVTGATVLSYVGETIPEDMRLWHFEGNTNRANIDVIFEESVPMGAKVWITAFWFNRRSESGPASAPVSAHIGFGALTGEQSQAA